MPTWKPSSMISLAGPAHACMHPCISADLPMTRQVWKPSSDHVPKLDENATFQGHFLGVVSMSATTWDIVSFLPHIHHIYRCYLFYSSQKYQFDSLNVIPSTVLRFVSVIARAVFFWVHGPRTIFMSEWWCHSDQGMICMCDWHMYRSMDVYPVYHGPRTTCICMSGC